MTRIRRELLNGLLVLVVASLLSVAFSAFQVTFNALLWVLILMGVAIAVSGYILFEITLGVITSAEDREKALAEAMRRREEGWLKRVGTPARLDLRFSGSDRDLSPYAEAVKSMGPGVDLTIMIHYAREGAVERETGGPLLFSDAQTKLDDVFAADDKLVIRMTIRGTYVGEDVPGFPKKGERFAMGGVAIYRFVDGKIVDDWGIQVTCPYGQSLGLKERTESPSRSSARACRLVSFVAANSHRGEKAKIDGSVHSSQWNRGDRVYETESAFDTSPRSAPSQ
jgi:hypothetical protein